MPFLSELDSFAEAFLTSEVMCSSTHEVPVHRLGDAFVYIVSLLVGRLGPPVVPDSDEASSSLRESIPLDADLLAVWETQSRTICLHGYSGELGAAIVLQDLDPEPR